MEKASSEPVLPQEAYRVPCHGIGDTGLPKRQLLGPLSKDDGANSSRINLIVKQAQKVPGPGKYVAHAEWTGNRGNSFSKLDRSEKIKTSGPDCRHYEDKEIMLKQSNASKHVLSKNPRTTMGQIAKGPKRSFLDQATRHGKWVPDPGAYKPSHKSFEHNPFKMTNWKFETLKHPSRSAGPEKRTEFVYNPDWNRVEAKTLTYTVPKETASNFLDKAVREKLVDIGNSKTNRPKREVPGPGTYPMHEFNDARVARGTKHVQLRGQTRNAVSGYF